jgi:Abortive infection alpha
MKDVFGVGKAIEKLMDPVTELIKRVAGPAADGIGLSLQDSIRVYRTKRQYQLFEKMQKFVEDAGYNPRRIPLKILFPLLDFASVEEDEDLHTRWAALLANAANPDFPDVPPSFPEILRQLSSQDANFLNSLDGAAQEFNSFDGRSQAWSLCESGSLENGLGASELFLAWKGVKVRPRSEEVDGILRQMRATHPAAEIPGEFLVSLDNLLRLGLLEVDEKVDIPTKNFPASQTALRTFLSKPSVPFRSSIAYRVTPLGAFFIEACKAPKRSPEGDDTRT